MHDSEASRRLAATTSQVRAQSAPLPKVLTLRDLVFAQVIYVVGVNGVGVAARVGKDALVYWLFAIVLYYIRRRSWSVISPV